MATRRAPASFSDVIVAFTAIFYRLLSALLSVDVTVLMKHFLRGRTAVNWIRCLRYRSLTFAKDVMFQYWSVCPCVCVQNISSCKRVLMIFSRKNSYLLSRLVFGELAVLCWILDHFPGFSAIVR